MSETERKLNQLIRQTLPQDYMANYLFTLQSGCFAGMSHKERGRQLALAKTDWDAFERLAMGIDKE